MGNSEHQCQSLYIRCWLLQVANGPRPRHAPSCLGQDHMPRKPLHRNMKTLKQYLWSIKV